MEPVDNNQFEIKPNTKSKRKIATPCLNAYLNPALDLLANEDPMCNTAMEIVPNKKRKHTRSCDIATFDNSALDLGISKAAVNEFLIQELENVRKNVRCRNSPLKIDDKENLPPECDITEPIYANLTDISIQPQSINNNSSNMQMELNRSTEDYKNTVDTSGIELDSGISVLEQKSLTTATFNSALDNELDLSAIDNVTDVQAHVQNQIIINNTSNLNFSFIDRLALDSPNRSNQSFYFDDDLNESNIMEIKTITIITKKKKILENKITNPFLDPNIIEELASVPAENPFLIEDSKVELEYSEEAMNRPTAIVAPQAAPLMPRRLFSGDTNSTVSTDNESSLNMDNQSVYENIDGYRSESPVYENVGEINETNYNKQSKILGCDVSQFSSVDIMNLNKNSTLANNSNESNESKKYFKHQILKVGNKLSKKVLKKIKNTFKSDKPEHNVTLNPYEVPRKPLKQKTNQKDAGIENPALNIDNSDEIEIEEIDEDDDEDHQYETIKTLRNTRLNMNVTPLRERANETMDISHNKTNTPGKKVRFDSTLNQEKVITGNSFDYDVQSPGFDAKIDKYHDELENCINEKKFLQQNM